MKKLVVLALGCLLTSAAFARDPVPGDQKWLQVVEQMVSEGKTTISTPKEERVKLLKDWAAKNGYSVKTSDNGKGFTLELSKKALASR